MSSVIKAKYVISAGRSSPSKLDAGAERRDATGLTTREAPPANPEIVVRTLLNYLPLERAASVKVRQTLDTARLDAETIVAAAEKQRSAIVEQSRAEGRDAGYEQGRHEGLEQGLEELRRQIDLLTQIATETHNVREQLLEHHYDDIVELAVGLAAKLTRRSGGLDPETARQLLAEMLPRTAGVQTVVVKLHPADLTVLQGQLGQVVSLADPKSTVDFLADERLKPGDVVVETERGYLDGTAPVRARRLAEQLLDVIEHGN